MARLSASPGAAQNPEEGSALHQSLRDRILGKLETLPDDRVYQVLDYIDFLESKYAERARRASPFQRFAEGFEDTLRAGRVSATAIAGTMTVVNRAVGVLNDVAAAGKSVATDVVNAVSRPTGASSGDTGRTPPANRP
jgi:hypothetical protein